jgi:hypothetical protein
MWREKSTGNILKEGSSWVDVNGTTHPRNWHIWSRTDKEAAGLEELTPDPIPDGRTWWYTQEADGKVKKTAKDLDDKNATDVNGNLLKNEKGKQVINRGVRTILIEEVKHQQGNLLAQSDWAIIRKTDTGTAIPSNIQTWRNAIRSKATAMETAITNAADTEAMEGLFLVTDQEGNVTGILYDWPELEE